MSIASENTASGSLFFEADSNSVYGRVFQKNVLKNGYPYGENAIPVASANDKTAIFQFTGSISDSEEFKTCKVNYSL